MLRPQDVGMLSSLGLKKIKVVRKIKVESCQMETNCWNLGKLSLQKIYDSNRYILNSFLDKSSITVIDSGIVKDKYQEIKKKL